MSEEKVIYETEPEANTKPPEVSQNMSAKEKYYRGISDYVYRGRCVRVVDGDTYDILCDLGFGVYHKIRVRVRGIDTPEKYGTNKSEEGEKVSELVTEMLFDKEVLIRTYKNSPSSYNRWEADVFFTDTEGGFLINIAKFLTMNGHAEHVEGYTL
jgi:micrococcal nuclease